MQPNECAHLLRDWAKQGCPLSDRARAARKLLRSGRTGRYPKELLVRFLRASVESVSSGHLYFFECDQSSEQGQYALDCLSQSIREAAELLLEIQDLEAKWRGTT